MRRVIVAREKVNPVANNSLHHTVHSRAMRVCKRLVRGDVPVALRTTGMGS